MDIYDPYAGTPPWDIGRPQRAIMALAERGEIRGRVLDVGCGTGENALFLAQQNFQVWGIDASSRAIAKATAKAQRRGLEVTFHVWDALDLKGLRQRFETIIDSGLFHIFSDEERPRFVESLATALKPGGTYGMICFSDREPPDWGGPRRVTQQEIQEAFRRGWAVKYIEATRFDTNFHEDGGKAWLSSITRLPPE